MKQKHYYLILSLFILTIIFFYPFNGKSKHALLIDNHPYQKTINLPKNKRKKLNLPPNRYYEQEAILEMNPYTGEHESYKLFQIQDSLNLNSLNKGVPGENTGNQWTERGPNNVPGRTRAVMYDPNDTTKKRVFAGGVSGGLWVIDNIEDPNAIWTRVSIPENLAVSSITYDPNNPQIFYLGTGESYAYGRVNGNGIWKSEDAGNTWFHVMGGSTGETTAISDAIVEVLTPTSLETQIPAVQTTYFGPSLEDAITSSGVLIADLALANDGTAFPNLACNPLVNSMPGKIAVIKRGDCNFTDKVKNSQLAGAIAVLVVNNVSTFPLNMEGSDASITIPSVMIGQNEGSILINALENGETISVNLYPVISSLPSGITFTPGKFHVNDIVTRYSNGITEVYAAIGESSSGTASTLLGGQIGLYKSINGGNSWYKLALPTTSIGEPIEPNDIYIAPDNTIYVTTKNSWSYKNGGGLVFVSTNDGALFTEVFSITDGNRVQIVSSTTNPDKLYILCYTTNNEVKIYKTLDAFQTEPSLLTNPIDPNFPTDPTNGQGIYNLVITIDPTNDDKVYFGGINTFISDDGGGFWYKATHGYGTSYTPYVHPDTHGIVINPINSNKGLISNDGGVYYVNDWSTVTSNYNAIVPRDNGYNTTQFYKGAIGQNINVDLFLGGTQDNGTNLIKNAGSGINSSIRISGGDGIFCFIDKDDQYMISSLYYNNYYKFDINGNYIQTIINNSNEGSFVNIAELDDNLDILYSNASTTSDIKISRFSLNNSNSRMDISDPMFTRPPTALRVSPYTINSTTLFVGTDIGKIYKVTNADTTPVWEDLTPEPYDVPFVGSISSINFGANENEIIVTFHNYGVVNIFFTEDGGATWLDKEGELPDMPVKDVLMNPLNNDEVIVATDLGVWRTTNFKDASPHWSRSDEGMQNVKVTSFDLRTGDNTILASTYGRGFFTGQFTADVNAINENMINSVFDVYPTVSNGQFKIKVYKDMNDSLVSIFDITGKQVFKKKITFNDNQIYNLSLDLGEGVYFVKINDIKSSQKIIIQ